MDSNKKNIAANQNAAKDLNIAANFMLYLRNAYTALAEYEQNDYKTVLESADTESCREFFSECLQRDLHEIDSCRAGAEAKLNALKEAGSPLAATLGGLLAEFDSARAAVVK